MGGYSPPLRGVPLDLAQVFNLIIIKLAQRMRDPIQPGLAFVIAINDPPGAEVEIGVFKHFVLGEAVLDSPVVRLQIQRAQFPDFMGFSIRPLKHFFCSSSLTENQHLIRRMLDRVISSSNCGQERRNSSYSALVQNPMTRSTPP